MTAEEAAARFLAREARLDAALRAREIGLFTHGSAMDDALAELASRLSAAQNAELAPS